MVSLGMSGKHAVIFEQLVEGSAETPLSLSRKTKLNRSSIYRYLEELVNNGLVEEVLRGKTKTYQACNPESLSLVVAKQEAKLLTLKEEVPAVVAQLRDKHVEKIVETQIKHFRGKEGLQQMLWNVVSSGKEFVGFGYEDWNTSVGKRFAEKLRLKMMMNEIRSREILNKVDDDYSYTGLGTRYTQVYEHRAIAQEVLRVRYDTYIYGDVFAYYYHIQGEMFGVEIHNREIAQTERAMFEILWKMAAV